MSEKQPTPHDEKYYERREDDNMHTAKVPRLVQRTQTSDGALKMCADTGVTAHPRACSLTKQYTHTQLESHAIVNMHAGKDSHSYWTSFLGVYTVFILLFLTQCYQYLHTRSVTFLFVDPPSLTGSFLPLTIDIETDAASYTHEQTPTLSRSQEHMETLQVSAKMHMHSDQIGFRALPFMNPQVYSPICDLYGVTQSTNHEKYTSRYPQKNAEKRSRYQVFAKEFSSGDVRTNVHTYKNNSPDTMDYIMIPPRTPVMPRETNMWSKITRTCIPTGVEGEERETEGLTRAQTNSPREVYNNMDTEGNTHTQTHVHSHIVPQNVAICNSEYSNWDSGWADLGIVDTHMDVQTYTEFEEGDLHVHKDMYDTTNKEIAPNNIMMGPIISESEMVLTQAYDDNLPEAHSPTHGNTYTTHICTYINTLKEKITSVCGICKNAITNTHITITHTQTDSDRSELLYSESRGHSNVFAKSGSILQKTKKIHQKTKTKNHVNVKSTEITFVDKTLPSDEKPQDGSEAIKDVNDCNTMAVKIRKTDATRHQVHHAGVYSIIQNFSFSRSPVWKKSDSNNWIWYCPLHRCWVITDVFPNEDYCSAGIVSPIDINPSTPIDTHTRKQDTASAGVWKIWDGEQWNDDVNDNLQLTCGELHTN